ncbi:hypothetical protein [Streptomyces regalis]|uniref:Uncharacterized protein n=1 Tax=Streptomyces regalis TaxID=68262 RepID=A0A0X3VQU3_9ACTN|nr:hypothetical protein ADL12_00780 [Streptomyces regalis]
MRRRCDRSGRRVALDEGALTGSIRTGVTFPEGDWRNWYFRDDRPARVEKRVDAILADLGIDVAELPSTALRFALAGQAAPPSSSGCAR